VRLDEEALAKAEALQLDTNGRLIVPLPHKKIVTVRVEQLKF
jgi:DNA-binding transcriptional regulator/RsmH inhibitor MraZ